MKQANVTKVSGHLAQGSTDRPVLIYVEVNGNAGGFALTHHQAERLLYDLHPIVQTLRGIAKKPRLRERPSAIWKALRGA